MGAMMATDEPSQATSLAGTCVLVVEDEYYIGDDLRRTLEASGAEVLGPCATLAQANAAIDAGRFDCAVLDLNLNGESGVPIAERLAREGRTFVIATGYGSPVVPKHLSTAPRIEKPFDPAQVVKMIASRAIFKDS